MKYTSLRFLKTFHRVRWETAGRTYGNDHSTLIGLLVDWWINLSPENFALESGPGVGGGEKGKGRGNCDAMFLEKGSPVGLLEVEGPNPSKWEWCAEKVGFFFKEFKSLQFAILLIYSYEPKGRGGNRKVKQISFEDILSRPEVEKILEQLDKGIIVIILNKKFERNLSGIRARNDYYKCTPKAIEGALVVHGKKVGSENFWPRSSGEYS